MPLTPIASNPVSKGIKHRNLAFHWIEHCKAPFAQGGHISDRAEPGIPTPNHQIGSKCDVLSLVARDLFQRA